MKILLIPLFAFLLFTGFKAAAVKTISGVVTAKEDGLPLPGVSVVSVPSKKGTTTDANGKYTLIVEDNETALRFAYIGYKTREVKIGKSATLNATLQYDAKQLQEIVVTSHKDENYKSASPLQGQIAGVSISRGRGGYGTKSKQMSLNNYNTESYSAINENMFHTAVKDPLSTFSIDVDAASYSNMRRFINQGSLPPKDAVRIEEMINYFNYEYPQPAGDDPVNIVTEISEAPWNANHKLVQIGLQGKTIPVTNLPASNLVFLIDVSGSMSSENKLPLLVSSFKLLTDQLREKDKIAIVVYAGSSGLVLPSTSGDQKTKIKEALNQLNAGGSTAGGEGIKLAYKVATENFIEGGNNRIILATDGDFNVGASSDGEMQRLIEEKRKTGVFLTVLGYGMGNYKDSKMETLADKGNGNYAYIDNITEARKVLVNEFGGTLFTIAKDVKLQIEFNPAKVQAYRLIGYENRMLKDEEFNDDKKDAGDLGSGHTVTALYEIIPVGVKSSFTGQVDDLKYQDNTKDIKGNTGNELLTVKLRYKQPDGNTSKLLQKAVLDNSSELNSNTSTNFRFAAAVAEFGMLLRQSEFKQNANFEQVIALAKDAMGKDPEGYRSEFLSLVKSARLMKKDLRNIEDIKDADE